MFKTLYVRVIITFVLTVTFSLAVSFAITYRINEDRIFRELEDNLIQSGKAVIRQFQSGREGGMDEYLSQIYAFRSQAALFGSDGTVKAFGNAKPGSFASPEEVQKVLNGGIHRFDFSKRGLLENRSVGLPFESNGKQYALFLKPQYKGALLRLRNALLTSLLLVLLIGSLLFVLAIHWLVKPIKKLTALTSRIAAGHFDERVPDRRQDEMGELARSFNRMSGELSQLERMRKEFVSNVSHEFQSPLTSIKGFAVAVRDNRLTEAQAKRYLTIIEDESERLAQLSGKLLRLSMLESEKNPLRLREYELDEQIRKVFLSLQPQWLAKGLEVDLSGLKPARIVGDEEHLEQVWHNLLSNSVKYTSVGGEIYVTMEVTDEQASIVFRDNGQGIEAGDLPRIFDRFYMGDKARDRGEKSSGLGLAIVRKIVELHGGSIAADSRLGEGAAFTVVLKKDITRTQ
ncbi:sensor histidine kinase [Cohnella rhizosphaerae]|uniref:Heme sensor protein HssS n=1 Tax=Cohnella rhizosphaerae TaxID=1457232 RepID=A0A9X4L488_9BACL|nr:HAMP domain-containing sensor histidine kinase [Cohnella rhizosphaerae]MDG0813489.1 HAMP domain-containing histidine kinase [Cohnella rhizosphaerae]